MTDGRNLAAIQRDFIPFANCGFPGVNQFRVVTAAGKILGQHERYPSEAIREGLAAWNALPEEERKPRAVSGVPRVAGYTKPPDPPRGGLILKSHVRALQRDPDGELTWTGPVAVSSGTYELPPEPQLDHVWLTEAEWRSMVPVDPQVGDVLKVKPQIAQRIATFHLSDKALGCCAFLWEKAKGEIKLRVSNVSESTIEMDLTGMARIGNDGTFPVRLQGRLKVDRKKNQFTRFDMIALGRDDSDFRTDDEKIKPNTYWYRLSPKYKVVLAIAFELVDGTRAIDRVPPYAIMFDSERTYQKAYLPKE